MNLGSDFFENITRAGKYRPLRSDPEAAQGWQSGITTPLFRESQKGAPALLETRFILAFFIVLLGFALLSFRLFKLQIVEGKKNFFLSEGNRVRIQRLRPERGAIFDRNNKILARNAPGFGVGIDLSRTTNLEEVVKRLTTILKMPEAEMIQKIEEKRAQGINEIILKSGVERELVFMVETHLDELSGVFTEVAPVREYPHKELLAHVLGYTGEISPEELKEAASVYTLGDRVGKLGLERTFDASLHGKSGRQLLETDAAGKNLREIAQEAAIPGNTVQLNLDLDLQRKTFESLKKSMEENRAVGGVVVVEEVNTGAILALAVLPSFDPNSFSKTLTFPEYEAILNDPRRPLLNRATAGVYPPGSTFKMVTAAAALEEGVVLPSTKIEEVQTIYIGDYSFSNWTLAWGVAPHGRLDIVQAIAHSSDIYFYEVGGGYGDQRGVGVENLASWAKLFGLGERTGIDLIGEEVGLVPDEDYKRKMKGEPWYLGDTYHMAIGQGDVLATPIQIANITATVANGGKLLRPFLAQKVTDLEGNLVIKIDPLVIKKDFVSPETLALVRRGMREAVEYGTAVALKNIEVSVAGKTGTSETGIKDKNHAWFTAFAPYEDPEIVVTVFVEGGGQGSVAALPVVREVLAYYFGEDR